MLQLGSRDQHELQWTAAEACTSACTSMMIDQIACGVEQSETDRANDKLLAHGSLQDNAVEKIDGKISSNEELAKSLELLNLDEVVVAAHRAPIDQSSGDFSLAIDDVDDNHNDDDDDSAAAAAAVSESVEAAITSGSAAAAAAARIDDARPRSVQWRRDVDVIYYAGKKRGGTCLYII